MLTGILDVSHHNGIIDWQAVADAGGVAMIAKATQGKTFRDKRFVENWRGAVAAGIIPGAYHFFNFGEVARKEADNFLDAIRQVWTPDDPALIALDLEWPAPADKAHGFLAAKEWLRIVEAEVKRPVLIYTSASFWAECGNPEGFERHPLWVAHYTRVSVPRRPQGWGTWALWQYLAGVQGFKGAWPGVIGDVDLNRFNGTFGELWALAGGREGSTSIPPRESATAARLRAAIAELQAIADGM